MTTQGGGGRVKTVETPCPLCALEKQLSHIEYKGPCQ